MNKVRKFLSLVINEKYIEQFIARNYAVTLSVRDLERILKEYDKEKDNNPAMGNLLGSV